MFDDKLRKVIHFYYLATTLKDVIRENSKYRGRDLSIAEHNFSASILAVALAPQVKDNSTNNDSAYNNPTNTNSININRVIMMLMLHELDQVSLMIDDNMSLIEYVLGDLDEKEEYMALIHEFYEHETPDSKFANRCDILDCKLQQNVDYGIGDQLNKNISIEAITFYLMIVLALRTLERSGWAKNWKINRDRVESVAEHTYGTCMLALAMHSEFYPHLDISKIIKMLTVHELEEVIIGDKTIYSDPAEKDNLALSTTAAKGILRYLINAEEYEKLINEFNTQSSEEAKFAFRCDKLEFELQGKIYSDEGVFKPISELEPHIRDNKVIQAIREEIAKRDKAHADDPFYINAATCAKRLLDTEFLDVLETVKSVDTGDIRYPSLSFEKTM